MGDVVVVGAGPTGMMLAGELALGGAGVTVVERRPDRHLAGSRAGGLHARTIEVFDQRGLAGRLLDAGQVVQAAMFGATVLDMGDAPTRHPYSRDAPSLDELRGALVAVYGTDFGVHSPTWISRFTDATRQADPYRRGRVLLAGDAAHIHYPAGGQGLGLGVADATNLGWKLAQVLDGTSPEALLDTYHAERHAVGARALRHTMAQTALQRHDDARMEALAEAVGPSSASTSPGATSAPPSPGSTSTTT